MQRPLTLHILVTALYTLLALILTWPLVQHLSTHVPGTYTWAFDEYTFLWNSWWFRYALTELHQNPLYSTYTFYPLGISLILYTYNLFNAVVAFPFQSLLSLPAISNLTFLLATVLSGYGTFLLARYLLSPRNVQPGEPTPRPVLLAAFLAGLIYAFGSYRMVYAALGHCDMWSTQWIPFYVLYLVKTIQEPRMRPAVVAGLFLMLAMLAEMIFGVFLAALTLILLAFVAGRRLRRRDPVGAGLVPAPGLVKRLVVLCLVAGVLYAPLLVPILHEMRAGYELAGWGDAQKLSVDLLGFVTPTALHPLGGDWVDTLRQVQEGTSRFADVNTVFLGWTTLALALVGSLAYRKKLAAWITGALAFAVLCLGPLLQINGRSLFNFDGIETTVPLPFVVLHFLPVVKANRVPNRFSVVLMLAIAVLAAFGAYWLLRRIAGGKRQAARWLVAGACFVLLAALLVFEHWSVPLPLTDARVPEVYKTLAADPDDYAILQLPLGWRNSFGVQGPESTQTQYYQTVHHKRLLTGNTSRNPTFKFDYFARVPVLESLVSLQMYGEVDAARRASDRTTAGEMLSFYDIRYVVVAPGIEGLLPYVDTRAAAVAYIEEVLPMAKVYDKGGWLLYQVEQPSLPVSLTVDLGSGEPLEAMALGEGWSEAEEMEGASAPWAIVQHAQLLLPVAEGANYRLTLRALPFTYPGAQAQEVTLWANGQRVDSQALSGGWGSYSWDVLSRILRAGLNDLRMEFARLDAPAKVLPDDYLIGATGIRAPVLLEVSSDAPANVAYITVGGPESKKQVDGSEHRAGYNVAVIDSRSGTLLDKRSFDTSLAGALSQSTSLAQFIAGVPEGQIVVVAAQGDALAHLSDDAVAAFQSVGGQADPRGHSGWSHAIIGVKGAAPATALEAAGPGAAWLRVAPDWRTLAVAVDSLTWERTVR